MPALDEIDLKILETLQIRGDLTNLKLADIVGLSPSPCLQRVKRLRRAGYIKGFMALVNIGKVTPLIVVYMKLELSEHSVRQYSIFETAILKVSEVVECSLMSGEFDYFLKVIARDLEHYNEIVNGLMSMDIGIKRVSMFVEVRNVKRTGAIPLRSLMPKRHDT
jgi:DNA-binding Lrp family transcriptional regulator